MAKKTHPHPAEAFSDPEMEQIKRHGEALGGAPTDFDEEVEKELNVRQRAREAGAAKMHAAQTGGSEGLGPTEAEQTLSQQRNALLQQQATQGAAQVQGGQSPPATPPPAPTGPQGSTTPYSSQAGAVGGAGQVGPPQGPPPAPEGAPEGEEQPPAGS